MEGAPGETAMGFSAKARCIITILEFVLFVASCFDVSHVGSHRTISYHNRSCCVTSNSANVQLEMSVLDTEDAQGSSNKLLFIFLY